MGIFFLRLAILVTFSGALQSGVKINLTRVSSKWIYLIENWGQME